MHPRQNAKSAFAQKCSCRIIWIKTESCSVSAPPHLYRTFARKLKSLTSVEESKLKTIFEMLSLNRASCFWEDSV